MNIRGQGSTFHFDLRLELAPEAAATPPDDLAEPASAEGLRGGVLLVEDNPVNQTVGVAMLESLGLAVVVTDNGEAALIKIAETAFAIVLMGCQMPVLDGYDATRRLRETERRDQLPRMSVIALTH
jgi:PleD family two-component response regulator